MQKLLALFAMPLLMMSVSGLANAVLISFSPGSQTTILGSQVAIGLSISGLGANTAPSLGAFDLDLSFDPGLLSFAGATYGDPILGDQLDLFGLGSITSVTPGIGTVNLFQLSFDLASDLDALQSGAFTLATLMFQSIALGSSTLGININALADSLGNALPGQVTTGLISISNANTVAEPPGIFLLPFALLFLVGRLRARNESRC